MSGYLKNPWITFLRQYGPVASNDAMYDEHVLNSAKRNGVAPLRFDSGGLLEEIVANFLSDAPRSVILTGTAGDGKTWLCREVWQHLGGDAGVWTSKAKIRETPLPCGARLVVLKDLSELTPADTLRLTSMAEAIYAASPAEVFLVAANDGQLRQTWERVPRTEAVVGAAADLIERLLVKGLARAQGAGLTLYNLSRQSSSKLMARVIDGVLAHEAWARCDGCPGQAAGAGRCAVWENRQRLGDPLFRERLTDLLELCDQSGFHLPVRQLLILASNMLLGHPDAKDDLLRCQDVEAFARTGKSHLGAIYRNTFGENLSESRRQGTAVFEALRRFGVGEETSNRIDNLLVYGIDDPELTAPFEELFRSDPMYGVNAEFTECLGAYLEGNDDERAARFTEVAVAQRQRLFFTMPRARADALHLWELTVFRFAGEYLNRVLRPLSRADARVDAAILKRLVCGLNRVFTGMLTSDTERLWLASSGSHSQARVCRIAEHELPVAPYLNAKVVIERGDDGPQIAVYLDARDRVALPLHLVRYEFLARVAEGALPSNFSRECYEDILSFKSRLLRKCRAVQVVDDASFGLRLLALDHEGRLHARKIDIALEDAQ